MRHPVTGAMLDMHGESHMDRAIRSHAHDLVFHLEPGKNRIDPVQSGFQSPERRIAVAPRALLPGVPPRKRGQDDGDSWDRGRGRIAALLVDRFDRSKMRSAAVGEARRGPGTGEKACETQDEKSSRLTRHEISVGTDLDHDPAPARSGYRSRPPSRVS